MATTALRIEKDGVVANLLFMTAPTPTGVDIDLVLADNDFMPSGGVPSLSVDPRDEETYHRELRIEASKLNQFVQEASTNPEWSPGYVEPIEDEHGAL